MHHRPTHRIVRIAAAAICVATGTVWAQISLEPPPGGGGTVAPPTPASRPAPPTATAPAPPGPSAESVLQGLLREKPGAAAPVAGVPTSAGGPALGSDGLLREGEKIELRAGHLAKQDNGAMAFTFDPKEKPVYPPMAVVPSRRLAAMEDFAKGADVNFPSISAEVTQYRGKNYLYIRPNGIPVPTAANPATAPALAPGPVQAAPAAPVVAQLSEGDLVYNRTGRLVRDAKTGAEMFVLDSDGKQMADPPMGVVPCQLLAVIEDATDHGNKAMKFKLSGEVTLYRGRNYLYVRKATVLVDLHQGITPGLGGQ